MKIKRVATLLVTLLLSFTSAFAADSYDPATGYVTIESIIVGSTHYRNVVLVPGNVVSFSTAPATATEDFLDLLSGRLTIRSITAGGVDFSDVVLMLASVVSIGSSEPATNGPSPTELATLLKEPFSGSNIEAAVAVLQQAGLTVVADDGAVLSSVSGNSTSSNGLGIFGMQTHSLALEASQGGGYLGSDIDQITPPIPLPPDGTGVDKQVTFSMLLAVYVKTGNSFGAQVARDLMGDLDPSLHGQYRYPALVLYTFMQEVMVPLLAEMEAAELPASRAAKRVSTRAAFDSSDPCGSVNTFLDDLPTTVSGAVGSLGGTSSGLWNSIVSVTSVVAGVATSAVTDVVRGVVRHSPAVTAVRNGMTALHALADLKAMASQWTVEISGAPTPLHKDPGSPTAGVFEVTLDNGSSNDGPTLPDSVRNCANLLAIPIPDFSSADGASVTWEEIAGFGELALQDSEENTLASNAAKFNFHSASESQAVHDNPSSQLDEGTVTVKATVSLPGVENLVSALASNLNTIAQTGVNGASRPVSQLAGLTAEGSVTVEYHTPQQARINAVTMIEQLSAVACDGVNGAWTGTLTITTLQNGSGSAPVSWDFSGGSSAPLNVSVSMTGGFLGSAAVRSITETMNLLGDSASGYSIQTQGSYSETTSIPFFGDVVTNGVREEGYVIEIGSFPECGS